MKLLQAVCVALALGACDGNGGSGTADLSSAGDGATPGSCHASMSCASACDGCERNALKSGSGTCVAALSTANQACGLAACSCRLRDCGSLLYASCSGASVDCAAAIDQLKSCIETACASMCP